jgi:anion-transporting  ArsA/GET3 family ATPase
VSKNSIHNLLTDKRCIIVCGGGGVGKTTTAASLALAATKVRKKVLVVTIDPAKRLAEAFGFTQRALEQGGEPIVLSDESKEKLGIAADVSLSVGILNPKYVLEQVVAQTLTPEQAGRLQRTMMYSQLSEMVYGLQEYTAYEWVTRMIQNGDYELIVLDTPPSFHAKDFFLVPAKIKNLMESKVFQLFAPKKGGWFKAVLSFGWVEKLLGEKVYRESRLFLETFALLRDRILERCDLLAKFFSQKEVAVVAVTTPESSAMFELDGLDQFLRERKIHLEGIIVNQVEQAPEAMNESLDFGSNEVLKDKFKKLELHQLKRSEKSMLSVQKCRNRYPNIDVVPSPMVYEADGFSILKKASQSLVV